MRKIRILVVDDHAIMRDAIRNLLKHQLDFEIVGEACNGQEAVEMAAKVMPDVVLMDIGMPEVNGLTATKLIKENHPNIKVLGLTMHEDDMQVLGLLEAGATGYLLKKDFGDELVRAIRAVHAGEFVFNSAVGRMIVDRVTRCKTELKLINVADTEQLTPRELQILKLVSEGMSNRVIANKIGIQVSTVKGHMVNIFVKMKVSSRTEAVLEALRLEWINIEETSSEDTLCRNGVPPVIR